MGKSFKIFLLGLTLALTSILGCSGGPYHDASFTGDLTGRDTDSTFIFVGDTQRTSFWERVIFREQNDGPRSGVLQEIAREDPAFVVLLGDIVDQGDDDHEWVLFDGYAAPIREARIPLYAVFGNHDYYGDKELALHNFFERFPHQKGHTWTSVRFHSVGIILLNSNFSSLTKEELAEQDNWYSQQLASFQADSTVNAIIVTCHHPPYTNSTIVSDDIDVQGYFAKPFMDTPKAAAFLTGHCHSYEHFLVGGKHFVVSGGGGGPRQAVVCDKHTRRHADLFDGTPIREFNFVRMTLRPHGLRVQVMMMDPTSSSPWHVGDEWQITTTGQPAVARAEVPAPGIATGLQEAAGSGQARMRE